MYRDLEPESWPEERPLDRHPIVSGLLSDGLRGDPAIWSDEDNVDDILHPRDMFHVVDADSSQAMAIEEVRQGRNLVIQGPPGTGKSQTISNLIAAAVKQGKKVLFVSEKMAALGVVKRRLENIGLGDMCLELHSHKSNKRTVLEELERMGRTGRRAGTLRNCLFLATKDETLVQAAGLSDLWAKGYVEPIEPPPQPLHVLAQQLMALALQESGIGRNEWLDWVRGVPGFGSIPTEKVEQLVAWMLEKEILWEEAGILALGREGEETYGRKNFLELFSVFMSPPLFSVLHGRQELGYVDEMTFLGRHEGPRVLLLGGRAWRVNHVDWKRRVAYVEATDATGRSRWKGEGQGLEFRLSQSIKSVLAPRWSRRACEQIEEIRHEFPWLNVDSSVVVLGSSGVSEWWTFGGNRANATLARQLSQETRTKVTYDSFTITFESAVKLQNVEQAIEAIRQHDVADMRPSVDEAAVDGLKFSECLPIEFATEMLERRLQDQEATQRILDENARFFVQQ